jgi:predicted nucleic acid-binding protein
VPGPESPVVVDTNVIFSALLRADSPFARILGNANRTFYVCESILVELFHHKERIQRFSRLSEDDVLVVLHQLLRRVHVYKEDAFPARHVAAARELCRDVDPADAPVVALALTLDGWLWTGDRALRTGLEKRGFTAFFDSRSAE